MENYFNLSFTKLEIWKSAHFLSIQIYKITAEFPKHELFGLTSQLRRAAISVVLCIAEGTGRYFHKDVIRFLIDARGSIREIQSALLIAVDLGYIISKDVEKIIMDYVTLEKQINKFIEYRRTKVLNSNVFNKV